MYQHGIVPPVESNGQGKCHVLGFDLNFTMLISGYRNSNMANFIFLDEFDILARIRTRNESTWKVSILVLKQIKIRRSQTYRMVFSFKSSKNSKFSFDGKLLRKTASGTTSPKLNGASGPSMLPKDNFLSEADGDESVELATIEDKPTKKHIKAGTHLNHANPQSKGLGPPR